MSIQGEDRVFYCQTTTDEYQLIQDQIQLIPLSMSVGPRRESRGGDTARLEGPPETPASDVDDRSQTFLSTIFVELSISGF